MSGLVTICLLQSFFPLTAVRVTFRVIMVRATGIDTRRKVCYSLQTTDSKSSSRNQISQKSLSVLSHRNGIWKSHVETADDEVWNEYCEFERSSAVPCAPLSAFSGSLKIK